MLTGPLVYRMGEHPIWPQRYCLPYFGRGWSLLTPIHNSSKPRWFFYSGGNFQFLGMDFSQGRELQPIATMTL
ncbi:hypothetical protein COMA2_40270 [Candidatus Nitrospira nitrificans]|uniref:Uncharacterized protein n=1 Tax=Candidatus Nitrospira nitrificans TaxID=1742973 RepID=A0A0S4LL77_9BACT|nr:hypothetical protein COMA2_40270 [Candidatus Nitrospira nitrificans]